MINQSVEWEKTAVITDFNFFKTWNFVFCKIRSK